MSIKKSSAKYYNNEKGIVNNSSMNINPEFFAKTGALIGTKYLNGEIESGRGGNGVLNSDGYITFVVYA